LTTSKPTEVIGSDINKLMKAGADTSSTEGRQGMHGFDPDYTDIVDDIVRCTHKIWEEKQVGLIYSHYGHSVTVHGTRGDTYGIESVVAGTVQTLATFPDRRLFADDVIWSGDDQQAYYTSHRITSTAHHWGYGVYGAPTGRKLRYRVIADCVVKENRIIEEWLVRDELSIARQLGLDEAALVKGIAERWAARQGPAAEETGSLDRSVGQLPPEPLPAASSEGFDVEDFVRRTWHDIWNRRMFSDMLRLYAPTYECHSASGRELYGHDDTLQFVLDWLAPFPDGRMSIDHVAALPSALGAAAGYRVAVRWTFQGTHEGDGIYGAPTGKRVRVLGITHQHVRDGKCVAEWTVFDELALMAQLYQG
jgi:predicted ester cyclase